jgi:glycosyltransferase involved in cell wall biosynthesis
MQNLRPQVSVVIPTLNSEKTIEQCIESIKNQSYTEIETIVVDGNSLDKTPKIAAENGCKLLFSDWKPLGARFAGASASSGDYVLLLDSDQILRNDAIERSVELMPNHDTLYLERIPYSTKSILEKLFYAELRPTHRYNISPRGKLLNSGANFYRRDLLVKAFNAIPKHLFSFVWSWDDAILNYEVSKISTNIGFVPNAIIHKQQMTITELWRKFFIYGKTSRLLQDDGSYQDLLQQSYFKRIESFTAKEKLFSLLLACLKAPAYLIGYYF